MKVLASGYPSLDTILPVSHSPEIGSTALILSDPGAPTFGGCGANVAVGLQKLGEPAGVAMVIGDDADGRGYDAYLRACGVDTRNLITLAGTRTSFSLLCRNPQGEYQNFFYAGAADAWQDSLTLRGLESLTFGLVTVAPYHYNRQFVALLAEAGVPIIWQLKPDIYAYPRDGMAAFARASRAIVMNRIEAEYLVSSMALADLGELLNAQTQMLVITRGADGVTVITADGEAAVPSLAVRVVDSVGAGDGFTTGFIAGLLAGRAPVTCAQWGVVTASFVLEQVVCQTNLPDRAAFEARYKEHFGTP